MVLSNRYRSVSFKPLRVRVRLDGEAQVTRGDRTHVQVTGTVHVFGADGQRLRTEAEDAS